MTRAALSSTVVFAVPDFEPAVGGTTRQVGLQARELAARGYDVAVVTRRRSRGWARHERLAGIDVYRFGPPGRSRAADLLALTDVGAWLARRRGSISALVSVMWPDLQTAAAAAGLLDRAVTVWAIEGEAAAAVGGSVPGLSRFRRRLLARSGHVVLTPAIAAELAASLPGSPASVIPVPVDSRHFRPPSGAERASARERLGLTATAFVAVYVGHLEARKAVDKLVDAWLLLLERDPSARLLLVGGGRGVRDHTEDELRARVARGGAGKAILFCGVQQDPRPYLWAADALVLASEREGMPNSLLEGMACGLPCVAPASAGAIGLLDDGGGLVPPTNAPAELTTAFLQLSRDPGLRKRLGERARERAGDYSVERVADEYERVLARLGKDG
jgi:glycosyltransferase involved in cell wall biosynthesis